MKVKFMQKMKNSFQAFVENNRFQALAGEREEEPVQEAESEEEFTPEGELPYGEEHSEPLNELQLYNYSDDELSAVFRRGDLNLLERALDYMGKEEFESRFQQFESYIGRLVSIILEQDSDEMVSKMTQLIMPEFFGRYSGEYGVYLMLNAQESDVISAEFVKLVLRLNSDDAVFTQDPSEIPMRLFIRASVAGEDEIVKILLSKSQAFLNAFNSKQAEKIFIELFEQSVHSSHLDNQHDHWQEIGFLLDKNPAFAELQEVQQAFIGFVRGYVDDYNNVEFLLNKSPVLVALYKTEEVQQPLIDQLRYNPSYSLIEFLLRQTPSLAENMEIQNAVRMVAVGYSRNIYSKLECLLNMHPDFAGLFSEEMEHNSDLREYDVRRYEEVKFLLDTYPALVGALTSAIRDVIGAVMHDGGYGSGYEKIESLLKNCPGFSVFLDEGLCESIVSVFRSRGKEVPIDTLLEICPGIGKFFREELAHRLKNHFAVEKLDYEGVESLLKYDPELGNKCHAVIGRRFSDDIKSENPNYEEIQFLSTKFPFVITSYYYSGQDFHRLFDKALSDNKAEFVKFLLKVKPGIVTDELHYNNNGKSIIEQAKNGRFPEDISANVLKAACELIYDNMRRDGDRYASVGNTELYKCLGDSLFDDAVSSAGRRDFTNVDLILSYFSNSVRSYEVQKIKEKFLKGSAARGDIDTMEHISTLSPVYLNVVRMMCDTALAHGQGEFIWCLVSRFPEIVVPQLVSEKGNVFESIAQKPVTHEGVNIVKHLLFVDALRQGMKPGGLKAYVDQLKLLCTTSKASYFSPLPDEVRCKIGEFLLDRAYQPYAKLKLRVQPSVPENTLHIEEATRYMTKVIMTIVNECLTHPLVGEQLHFRTNQCFKWIKDKMTKSMGKLGVISKSLQIELVHDVWQAMVDQPSHKPRVKKAVEDAIDAVLGHHLLLEADTPALGLAGDHYEPYEAKDGEYAAA